MKSQICLFIIALFQLAQSQNETVVAEGGSCGFLKQVFIKCDTGLTCLFPTRDPNGEIIVHLSGADRLGVCQRPGVTSSTSSIIVTGTSSTVVTGTSSTVSQPSATPVAEGGSCGGFSGFPQVTRICDTGLTCFTPTQDPNGPIIADLPGTCRRTSNIVGEGESCEGKTRPEDFKVCQNGLICVYPEQIKDLPGVCRNPSVTTRVSSATQTSSTVSQTVSSTETAYIPISSFTITVGPTATQTGTASYDDGVTITSSAKSLSFVGLAGLLAFFLL